MRISVLIEPAPDNRYSARAGEPFACAAEGATPFEAMQRLRKMIQERIAAGARLLSIEVPLQDNPLAEFEGMFPQDDPLVQEWKQIMAENRRKADKDPDVL
jgi:predicted RNase H-like HicB family nuclease